MRIYREMSEKARKNTPKNSFNLIRSYKVRAWFNSTLLNAGYDFFHAEEFMGHSLPATQNHYYQTNSEGLKEYYSKFIPYLTIQKDLDVSTSQEYQAIVRENEILREKQNVTLLKDQNFRASVEKLTG